MSTVKVRADKNGNVIAVSENNPEYGWIIVEQLATQMENNWLKKTLRTARIMGKVEDFIDAGLNKAGAQVSGKIVVVESLTPFNPENPDLDMKVAGSTGVICRVDDQPIYRKSMYTANLNACDEFIAHTNTEEIREVMLAQRAMDAIKNFKREEQKADEPQL